MIKLKCVLLFLLFLTLSSCSSVQMNKEKKNDRDIKKIETAAVINAQLGLLYLDKHDISRAKQKLLLALEEAPKLPEIWYAMGYFLETTGSKQEARTHYLKALALAPKRGDVLNNYGTYLCRMGDYQGAIAQFTLAVKDPGYLEPAAAYENAGLCAMKIPDQTLAANYFRLAIAQDPNRLVASQELVKINQNNSSGDDHENLRLSSASN